MIDERPLAEGGFVTLITDVTERRRADHLLASIREEQRVLARRYHEEKLRAEAASRSKTSFLAHLSHDIRTPLNHIIGFAELIRHETYGPLGDRRYADYIDTIHMSGERLLSYFASILELAEFEGGRRPQRLERVDADDLLAAMTRRFAAQAGQAGLALRIGSRCGAAVHADRFSLERMLINLVDNALRFTPAGGRVTLSAYAALDGVVLEITDTGIGIAPERLETLSQPFAFRDDVLTREQPGCGLGIAIARAIAETSGGHLAIDSRIGLGTTVAISLPLQPAASAAQAIAA
jgi:two-component system cell cycle sensor histidine kinase PleC